MDSPSEIIRLIKKAYHWIVDATWVMMVVTLPVTSFPMIANIFGGTSVAPLPVVFLAILTIGWYLPHFIKERRLPRHAVPLLVFVILALISTLAGDFLLTPSFRAISPWRNSLEGIITLAMGVCFYLVISEYLDSKDKINKFIRLINYSGLVMVVYAIAQAVIFQVFWRYPDAMHAFHGFFSSSFLFVKRTTGFAYEPSWYAHLLNLVYLPIWLGLSIKKVSVHRFRLWKIRFEHILLALGLISLFLSYSRIGWLSFILVFGYLLLRVVRGISQAVVRGIQQKQAQPLSRIKQSLIQISFWLGTGLVFVGLLLLAGKVLTVLDPRMEGLFEFSLIREKGLLEWAGSLIFAERLIYWNAGYRVFMTYPILGVGLGRVGYYFQNTFDSFGYKLPEILSILLNQGFIPNAKNLWVRILAESGLVGFSLFATFCYVHWQSARVVEKTAKDVLKALGLTGQIFIIALLVEGFSVDSFGLPFLWTSMALIAASYRVSNQEVVVVHLPPEVL